MKKLYNVQPKFMKAVLMMAVMLFLIAPSAVKAQTPDGSESNPFPIRTKAQLTSLAERINGGGTFYFNPDDSTYTTTVTTYSIPNMGQGKFFKLVDDITMNSGDVASCDGVLATGWTAWPTLGTLAHPFNGTFDGDGHLLSGLYVSVDNGYAGFFGCTGNLANIKNLGLVNSYVASTGNAPEGNNCGGLIGMATQGTIEKCFYSGTVQNNANYTGGLVGQIQSGTQISNCYTSGFVTGNNQVAGLVGFINTPAGTNSVTESYSAMLVRAAGYSGGAIGEDRGNGTVMTNVYYDRQLLAMASPNTLGIGLETSAMTSGTWYPAGFAASGSGLYPRINLAGFDPSTHPNVYLSVVPLMLPAGTTMANLNSVNTITLGGGASVSWALAESVGAVSLAGTTITIDGQCYVVPKVTLEVSGTTYTRSFPMELDKTPYIGTAENPFQIDNLTDLTNFRDGINSGVAFLYKHFMVSAYGEGTCFIQTADIEMPNSDWMSIGSKSGNPFKGTYDGGNHAVIGWKCSSDQYAFFRYVEGATIKNLTISNVLSGNYAALIYSMKGGTVDNCHAEGSTTIKGGLIYETAAGDYTCNISNCTNKNNLNVTSYMGGIIREVGSLMNNLTNCENWGNIYTTYARVGGIIGQHKDNNTVTVNLVNCANRGNITTTSDSYDVRVGGIAGRLNGTITFRYCFNTGTIKGSGGYVAGIYSNGSGTITIDHCYNLGNIESGATATKVDVSGISCGHAVASCFNAGKIIQTSDCYSNGVVYGLSVSTGNGCFNAGDLYSNFTAARVFPEVNISTTPHYNIARVQGLTSVIGGAYYDPSRSGSFVSAGTNGVSKTTAQMTASNFLTSDYWVCEQGYYPRVKGLDEFTISKALALPIYFDGTDNVDNVTSSFTVRTGWGIKWKIEGTSGATISDPDANQLQTVTLNADRTRGNIILAAYKNENGRDSVYHRITLIQGVSAPTGELTITCYSDLDSLRRCINRGGSFKYKNVAVPAGGEGTIFKVTANISMGEGESVNWEPIGNETNSFKGTFDGGNFTISNFKQWTRDYFGLFGTVRGGTIKNVVLTVERISRGLSGGAICAFLYGGTISNCRTLNGTNGMIGMGYTSYNGDHRLGGIAGYISESSRVTKCTNEVRIEGVNSMYNYSRIGGIVGSATSNSVIDSCVNAGEINCSSKYIAGICATGGQVNYCVNYGKITAGNLSYSIAGIALGATITGCVNSGHIILPMMSQNDARVAGIGSATASNLTGCTVSNSYNVGAITGKNALYAAGVYVGKSTCENNYNAAKLSGDNMVAISNATSSNCFYDTQMTLVDDDNAAAKTTQEMCALTSDDLGTAFEYETNMYPRIVGLGYTPASVATASPVFLANSEMVSLVENDFTMGGCTNHSVVWALDEGEPSLTITGCGAHIAMPGMPYLNAKVGDVTYKKVQLNILMDALIIKNKEQLEEFRACINSNDIFYYEPSNQTFHRTTEEGHSYIEVAKLGEGVAFKLADTITGSINLGGATWEPIGNTATICFKGTFDGNGKTIENYTLKNSSYTGLFGYIESGTVRNLIIQNAITPSGFAKLYAGSLAGQVKFSTVENIHINNCSIKSTSGSYIGGMAGYGDGIVFDGIVVEGVQVKGNQYVGGGAGSIKGNKIVNTAVSNSLIESTNTSKAYAGGFAGSISGYQSSVTLGHFEGTNNDVKAAGSYAGGFAGSAGNGSGLSCSYMSVYGGTVTGKNYVAGLVGYETNMIPLYVYCSDTVIGQDVVGGIVGSGAGSMFGCYWEFAGVVIGRDKVGGLVAGTSSSEYGGGSIYNSVNSGKVTGRRYVGGIRGYAEQASSNGVYQCVNLGDVTGEERVGGIIGYSYGSVYGNVNAGRVTGTRYVGGIVGYQQKYAGYTRRAHHNYSSGQVYGEEYVGSVAGYCDENTVINNYYDKQMSSRYKGLGTTGEDASGVAEGKLTREMLGEGIKDGLSGDTYFIYATGAYPVPKNTTAYDGAKVAATPIVLGDTVSAYTIPGQNNYPVSPSTIEGGSWSKKGDAFAVDGTGFKARQSGMAVLTASLNGFAKNVDFIVNISRDMPCIIKNYAQLTNFTNFINSGNAFYYNTADSCFYATAPDEAGINAIPVAAGGEGFFFKLGYDPSFQLDTWPGRIGTPASPFKGEFNGAGRTVSYLPNATTDTCGFFGYNAGRVYNLNFDHTNITNTRDYVGVVAGYNTGKIDSCHVVNGTVSGTNYVGAIAGKNEGYVSMCYSSATVNGSNYVGGLCGMSTNSVTNSFNMGDVNGTTFLGGVVGSNSGALANAYNTGNITATGFPNNVGGVVGSTGNNFSNCYSAGQVTADGENVGGIAGYCAATNISTVAYDNQMCSVLTTFQDNSNQAVSASTLEMTGNALQSVLGTDNWIYADSTYPRVKGMELLDASILSTTPVFLSTGEKVLDVEHDFRVYTNNGGVNWSCDDDAINMDNVPDISFNHCGHPVLVATRGVEEKHINLLINYTGSVTVKDTTCGEPYTWETSNHGNGFTYETSQTVLFPTVENGCPFTYTLELIVPEPLKVTVSSEPERCYGANDGTATATVTGGLGSNYTYEWTDLDSNRLDPLPTSATITGLAPEHEYRVVVTDALNTKNCTIKDSVEVVPAVELVATVDSVDAGCYGVVDGFFLVSFSGGKAPYTLSWSGAAGSGSRDIENPTDRYRVDGLGDGAITITVKDANNCEKSFDTTFNQDATAYTVTAYAETKVYDGVAVEAGKYTLAFGSVTEVITSGNSYTFTNGDVLTAEVSLGNVTDAGVYSNTVTSYTVMRGTKDVTCYYNITTVNSNVVISKRPVTLTSADTVVFYPDVASNPRVTVTSGSFADGETVTYNVTGLQQGSGVSDNTFTINWGSVNGNNYDTTKVYGTLTVVKNGVLIVRGASLNRMYDGTTDTYNSVEGHDYTVAAYFVRGENDTVYGLGPEYRVEVVMNNGNPISMKDADTVENRVTSFHAYYHDPVTDADVDVTMEFDRRDTIHGTLAISRREVELVSQGNTWEYDAEAHSLPTVTVVGSFVEGEVDGTPVATATITNVGKVTNVIDYHPTASFNINNYKLTLTQDTLKVTPRTLTIAGVNKYVEVTGELQEDNDFTYSGLVNGHTASGISFHAEGTEIGEYPGDFSGTLAVEDASHNDVTANYDPDYQRATLYITSADKDLNVVSATSHRMYNGEAYIDQTYTVHFGYAPMTAITPFRYKLTTGDTVLITPTDDAVTGIVNAGSYRNNFRISILPEAHAANYRPERLHLDTGVVTVDPRTVTLRSMSKTKVYDGEEVKWDSIQGVGNGFVSGEGVTGTNFRGGNHFINVGTYANANTFEYDWNAGTLAANYAVTIENGTLEVTPATLTVKANDLTRYYGEPNEFTYTVTGFAGTDDITVVNGRDEDHPSYTCEGGQYANIGTYTITPVLDGLSSANYTLEPATGTLTVQKRTMVINAPSVTATYDGTAHTQATDPIVGTITYTNLADGDVATATMQYSRTTGGQSQMTYSSCTIMHGSDDVTANYNITVSDTSLIKVTAAPLTVKVVDTTKVYDGEALVASRYQITSGALGDGDAVEESTVVYSGSQTNVGTSASSITQFIILRNETDNTSSYDITFVDGTLEVTPKAVTLTAADSAKTYDGTALTQGRFTATALESGDTHTFTVAMTSESTITDAGTQPNVIATVDGVDITAAPTAVGNYLVTTVDGSLTINRKEVTLTAADSAKTYDGTALTQGRFTATALESGDTHTFTVAMTSESTITDAGTQPNVIATVDGVDITTAPTEVGNYLVTTANGTLTVNRKEVTLTAADSTKMYDGTALTQGRFTATALESGDTHTFTVAMTTESTITDAGTQANVIATVDGVDITTSPTEVGNYSVTTAPGTLTITPRTPVAVTIQEHGAEYEYDGSTKSVSGYSVSISDPLYLESYITFSGTASVSGVGSETALTTYPMQLQSTNFTNNSANFTDVTFTILDSAMYIYPKLKAEVTDLVSDLCLGGDNGAATIVVTGGKPNNGKYNFSLNGGAAVAFTAPHTYDHLTVNDYTVVITDSLNKSVTVTFSIEGSTDVLTATIVTPTELCPNQGNYPVSVNVSGGSAPYTYTWTGAQDVNAPATEVVQTEVNDGGTAYTVSVSILDANSCPVEANATFTVKPSVTKTTSLSNIVCPADMNITLRYGVYDTLLTLIEPTWTSNITAMPLTLVNDAPVTRRFAVSEGREDSTYTIHWHLVDTCGGDSLICTQTITVAFPACAGTVTDANGNSYEMVRLGANCWTRSNLVTPVPPTRSSANGEYKYNNDDALAAQFGLLYSWYAASHLPEGSTADPTVVDGHVQGICPTGWALPTAEDYIIMVDAIGGVPHMKITDSNFWITGLEGSAPSSGFDALGAGYYKSATDTFEGLMTVARFWTATPTGSSDTGTAIQCAVCEGEDVLIAPKSDGYSIRCVRVQ